ncbi:MAG TPA: uracil-DNA glycosylase [Kineosporiaceae bacterium]|nr:uracil-DNA glycosylase [Kineosporiaceae bacterium]
MTPSTPLPRAGADALLDVVHPEWSAALAPAGAALDRARAFLAAERARGAAYMPGDAVVLRAFARPPADVKVLILGQDPYPTPGHPMGLAFSVDAAVRPVPRSLANVFRELADDVGVPAPSTGDLSAWSDQGVLLLNRVLTVEPGRPGSHRGKGWEGVTEQAVRALVARGRPLVAVLWGREAQALRPLLGDVPVVESVHPSPLSASRGFFGSRPFSRVNQLLTEQGADPVDWRLP